MIIRRFTAKLPQGAVDVGCIQDQGAREYQEDTAGFSEVRDDGTAERFAAVVADGMGGMASGGFVSDYTVKNLLAANIGSPEELCAAVRRISGEIAAGVGEPLLLPCTCLRVGCISVPSGTAGCICCMTEFSPG